MAQEAVDDHLLTSLKVNINQGWNIGIFQNQQLLESFVCIQCKCVCCDAVELGCDHDDNDIFLYCNSCLTQLVKDNDDKCPIDQHNDPIIIPTRTLRKQISKLMTFCPYSTAYKSQSFLSKNDDNNKIMDTFGAQYDIDQKEGGSQHVPPCNLSPQAANVCQWNGSLYDLIHKHIAECVQKNDPLYSLRGTIKGLEHENKELKEQNIALQNKLNQAMLTNEQYSNDLKQTQKVIEELKNENTELNEVVAAMQKEDEFQPFQYKKLKHENMQSKQESIVAQLKYKPLKSEIMDTFDTETNNENVRISQNGKQVTQMSENNTSTFGTKWIHSSDCRIFKWQFYIKKMTNYMGVGIATNDENKNKRFYEDDNQRLAYIFWCDGDKRKKNKNKWEKYGSGFKTASRVTMIMDLLNRTISWNVNDKDFGVAFGDIPKYDGIKFKMAVIMYYEQECIDINGKVPSFRT